jgi:translation elongation factor EF-Tu-like GTPase
MTKKTTVNVGTIGHCDHGISINTGDYIDPTPWTPEDHERFKKAMVRVDELQGITNSKGHGNEN